ncbi:hypothetical protein IID19_05275 [Patescibacteria group bacterium]|nr:hypothetical protein [Patescibacteria group bacterium]
MEEQDENKIKVGTKINTGTKVAIGISIFAIVVAGGGLLAEFSGVFAPKLRGPIVQDSGGSPTAFSLLSPANGAIDQDVSVSLTWEQSTEKASIDAQTQASPNWSLIKSANATHANMKYEVHFGLTNPGDEEVGINKVATITSLSYTATSLKPDREYTWRIVADTGHAKKGSRETWTFTTAGADWLSDQDFPTPDPGEGAACGGQRECDANDILSCTEWNNVWLACNGIGNKCPDSQTDHCLQMTICQCSGIPPSSDACAIYVSTFTDPCSI